MRPTRLPGKEIQFNKPLSDINGTIQWNDYLPLLWSAYGKLLIYSESGL